LKFDKFNVTLLSIALASALWIYIFLLQPYAFWTSLSLATFLLMMLSLIINGEKPAYGKVTLRMIIYGITSGLLLYALFYAGFQALRSTPFLAQGVSSVYKLRQPMSTYTIALLLIFPIAPGEETYWRGLVQRRLSEKVGAKSGLFLATIAYALVHLPTLNPTLIFTALIDGLVWGILYQLTDSLVPGIISHALWDVLIFVVLPLA